MAQDASLVRRVLDQVKARGNAYPLAAAPLTYYTVPAMSPVKRLPNTFPEDGELCGTLQIVAARGEFEPASFVIFPFADAAKSELKSSPLTGAGTVIPADNVDLKVVKCWYQGGTAWYSYFADISGRELVPELLLNDENLVRVDPDTRDNYVRADYPAGSQYIWVSNPRSVDVPFNAETEPVADARTIRPFQLKTGEFKQFWMTVKVPADATPGVYRGSIDILVAGAKVASVPVQLRVLPFELPKPMTRYDLSREFHTMLYNGPGYDDILKRNGGDGAHADRKMLALYENMRDHNILHPLVRDFTAKSRDSFVRQLELLRQAGLSTDTIFGAIPGIPPHNWMTSPAVQNTPLRDQALPDELIKRVDESFEIVTKLFGRSTVYCFGWDEPPRRLVIAERGPWKYIHDKGLKVYSTATDKHLQFSAYNEDFVNCPGEISRERANRWHALGARITNYASPHTGPENPDCMRRVHGLRLYKANYDGIGNYILDCSGWNDFLGETHNFRGFNMTYPTRDGVIDTLEWEGIREAVDDVRYATLLQQLAVAAIATGKTEAIYAGRRALQWLELLDEKEADLNAARLEMINRILTLSQYSEIPKAAPKASPTNASPLPEVTVPAKAALTVEAQRQIMARPRVSAKDYRDAAFKVIELFAQQGKGDEARAAADEAGNDGKLAVGDRFQAKLTAAGLAMVGNPDGLKAESEKSAALLAEGGLTAEMKVAAYQGAGKFFMTTRQYPVVRAFISLAEGMYRKGAKKVYSCRFVDNAPTSVEGWQASPLLAEERNRESRFDDYDRKAAEFLINDVNAVRAVGQEGATADKKTSFAMAADVDGLHILVECGDSQAEKVSAGLLGGGQLEMFLVPGFGECYYQWFVNFPKGDFTSVSWSNRNRHYRPMDSYVRAQSAEIKGGFGTAIVIPWEMVYDKLPSDGGVWAFNVIRWTRAGGVTWSGKVHNLHDFGMVRWEGLTADRLTAIKRKIVLKAVGNYRKAKADLVAYWKDEVLGDPAFYNESLLPVIERLDVLDKKAEGDMTAADVTSLFDAGVPDWMEFQYKVAELRQDYLKKMLADAQP
jgi:hypothetical protein